MTKELDVIEGIILKFDLRWDVRARSSEHK